MVYKYRVTLAGLKGFFRLYEIDSKTSLYTFHKQLRSDLEFTLDQPILFKAFDACDRVVGRYALIDLGDGTVDDISIAKSVKNGITHFQYFYDVSAKKSVIITLEDEDASRSIAVPTLLESKGPVPLEFENGYVAFEDLPDDRRRLPGEGKKRRKKYEDEDDDEDDFDDDEDEDEDDESEEDDEEIIYDENE